MGPTVRGHSGWRELAEIRARSRIRVVPIRHSMTREHESLSHQPMRAMTNSSASLVGRHAARGRAADVRMMGAIDHETAVLGPVEERCDEGDVREVRPAQVGIVQDHHVSRCRPESLDDPRHREGHAAEVHRDVRGLGRQPALRVETVQRNTAARSWARRPAPQRRPIASQIACRRMANRSTQSFDHGGCPRKEIWRESFGSLGRGILCASDADGGSARGLAERRRSRCASYPQTHSPAISVPRGKGTVGRLFVVT